MEGAPTNTDAGYKLTLTGPGIRIDKEIDANAAADITALLLVGSPKSPSEAGEARRSSGTRRSTATRKEGGRSPKRGRGRSSTVGVTKDLSLRPNGKASFVDFVNEKQPKTHQRKQTAIVFWLRHEAGLATGITPSHVNTCYLEAGWTRPADLYNSLLVTAAKKGWLDTSDMGDIKVTPRGEDEVRHNLPPQPTMRK